MIIGPTGETERNNSALYVPGRIEMRKSRTSGFLLHDRDNIVLEILQVEGDIEFLMHTLPLENSERVKISDEAAGYCDSLFSIYICSTYL